MEVKLRVHDRAAIERLIGESGASLLHPREFEDNHVYDFPDRELIRRGAMLRVRLLERQTVLTFKDRARVESGVKVRQEIEAALSASESDALRAIVGAIGLTPVFRYQKYRTTWQAPSLLITLDETPIGDFLELEGDRERIDAMATTLGFSIADYIAASYRDLYIQWLESRPGNPGEMVFG